jgi:hypothetical protein
MPHGDKENCTELIPAGQKGNVHQNVAHLGARRSVQIVSWAPVQHRVSKVQHSVSTLHHCVSTVHHCVSKVQHCVSTAAGLTRRVSANTNSIFCNHETTDSCLPIMVVV